MNLQGIKYACLHVLRVRQKQAGIGDVFKSIKGFIPGTAERAAKGRNAFMKSIGATEAPITSTAPYGPITAEQAASKSLYQELRDAVRDRHSMGRTFHRSRDTYPVMTSPVARAAQDVEREAAAKAVYERLYNDIRSTDVYRRGKIVTDKALKAKQDMLSTAIGKADTRKIQAQKRHVDTVNQAKKDGTLFGSEVVPDYAHHLQRAESAVNDALQKNLHAGYLIKALDRLAWANAASRNGADRATVTRLLEKLQKADTRGRVPTDPTPWTQWIQD